MVDPLITIDPGGPNELQLKCHGRNLSLVPEDNLEDVETFCAPGLEQPGTTTWTSSISLLQSFGADGAWNLLHAMRKTRKTILIQPTDAAGTPAVGNPTATFEAFLPSVPFVDAGIGEKTEFDFELTAIGEPVFATA